MKVHWPQTWLPLAVLILVFGSASIDAAQAQEKNKAGVGPGQRVLKPIAEHSGKLEAVKRIPSTTIEQVEVNRIDQHTQVRVEGSGELSCVSFRLNHPERLVLDCSNAHVGVRQKAISSDLSPVRGVRLGQFKDEVARLVVDLEKKAPYSLRPSGNVITVVFEAAPGALLGSAPKSENEPPNIAISHQRASVQQTPTPATSAALQTMQLPDPLGSKAPMPLDPTAARAEKPAPALPEARPGAPRSTEPAGRAINPAPKGEQKAGPNFLPPDGDYVIGPQDVLAINVWREPEISRVLSVRPDGRISLPLVGEMIASGLTPSRLESQIAGKLESFIRKPQVTVVVQEATSHKFYMMGEVERPGVYPLAANMTVLDALAAAGGFREFAKVKDIYLLRRMPDGSRKPIPYNLKAVVDGRNPSADLELQPGDTIVVP